MTTLGIQARDKIVELIGQITTANGHAVNIKDSIAGKFVMPGDKRAHPYVHTTFTGYDATQAYMPSDTVTPVNRYMIFAAEKCSDPKTAEEKVDLIAQCIIYQLEENLTLNLSNVVDVLPQRYEIGPLDNDSPWYGLEMEILVEIEHPAGQPQG